MDNLTFNDKIPVIEKEKIIGCSAWVMDKCCQPSGKPVEKLSLEFWDNGVDANCKS